MSTEKYVKFISEQQKNMINNGLANYKYQNTDNEFDDIIEAVIDSLSEEIEELQELSPELKSRYRNKAVANIQRRGIKAGRTGNNDPKIANRVKGVGRAGGNEQQAGETASHAKDYGNKASKHMPVDDDDWDAEYFKRDRKYSNMRHASRHAKRPPPAS